jgi:uncharacterized protein involved in exopolysaccharide biosynthesis
MRRATIGILALAAFSVAGCGGGAHFANNPRPPTPVDLTVYINNNRVLVSPSSVGGGPVIFIITNQSSQAQSLTIQPASGGTALASTAPINPQATSQIQVNFSPGNYTMTTGNPGSTDANQATPSSIQPASLYIGPKRANGNNVLLQP